MAAEIRRQIAELPAGATALTKHTMNGASMKNARHVVTEEHPEGTYLFRYADDWSFSGDTWHPNLEEALGQAQWEFSVDQLLWRPITKQELLTLTNGRS
jgi:hypothetical protein